MDAKEFKKLKVGDRLVFRYLDAPFVLKVGADADTVGRVVASLQTKPVDSMNENTNVELTLARTFRNIKTFAEIAITDIATANAPISVQVAVKFLQPYTWPNQLSSIYPGPGGNVVLSDYDKLAIQDPASFLKNQAALSWVNAKEFYQNFNKKRVNAPQLSHPNGGMQALLDYRSWLSTMLVDSLAPIAAEHIRNKRRAKAISMYSSLLEAEFYSAFALEAKPPAGNAPGSSDPTSDIDINTYNDGTEYLVAAFNDAFGRLFEGKESGYVMDVNLYGKDFLPKLDNMGIVKNPKVSKFVLPIRDHEFFNQTTERQDADFQMQAALLKLRRYMADKTFVDATSAEERSELATDWDTFKRNLQPFLGKNGFLITTQTLTQIEEKFRNNQEQLATIMSRIRPATENQTTRNVIEANPTDLPVFKKADPAALMSAENRIYEAELQNLEDFRVRFDILKYLLKRFPNSPELGARLDDAYADLRNALSNSLYFANEAYVTSGAVTQVVGGKQQLSRGVGQGQIIEDDYQFQRIADKEAKRNIAYGAHELMHSIIDNLSDIYKETKRHQLHSLNAQEFESQVFGESIMKSAKYIHRMFNAIKHLREIFLLTKMYLSSNQPEYPLGTTITVREKIDQIYQATDCFALGTDIGLFLKSGFGIESLKKLNLNWSPGSVTQLQNILVNKFAIEIGTVAEDAMTPAQYQAWDGTQDSLVKPFYTTKDAADQIGLWQKENTERMKFKKSALSADDIAGILLDGVFKKNFKLFPGGTYQTSDLSATRLRLSNLAIEMMEKYYSFCEIDERLVTAALKWAGRPYPRLNPLPANYPSYEAELADIEKEIAELEKELSDIDQ